MWHARGRAAQFHSMQTSRRCFSRVALSHQPLTWAPLAGTATFGEVPHQLLRHPPPTARTAVAEQQQDSSPQQLAASAARPGAHRLQVLRHLAGRCIRHRDALHQEYQQSKAQGRVKGVAQLQPAERQGRDVREEGCVVREVWRAMPQGPA